uniref:MYB transcription factor n=1 Tax=Anisakis simplex TaxID=6269 RepID=A0A0M3JAT6_ANISI
LEDLIASLERDMPSTFFDVNNGPSPGNDHFSDNDNDGNFTLEPICLPSHHKQEQQQACKDNTPVWSQQPSTQFAVHQTSHLDQSTINHVDAMPTQVPNVDRHISAIDAVQSSFERPISLSSSAPSRFIPSKQNSLVDETKLQSVMWTDLSSESPANLEVSFKSALQILKFHTVWNRLS